MPEFIENLPADQIVWGAFKVVGVDDRGNTVSRRPKYIFVKYFPETVGGMKRGRAGGHKGVIKQIMNAHIDVEVNMVTFNCWVKLKLFPLLDRYGLRYFGGFHHFDAESRWRGARPY